MEQRAFKGIWIPSDIWLDKGMSPTEKCMLSEIDSLEGENGCFATNRYFADFFDLSTRQIQRIISSLESAGKISVNIQGEKRIIKVLNKGDRSVTTTHDRSVADLRQKCHPYNIIDNKRIDIFIEKWNSNKDLPKIVKMTDKRKKALNSRCEEYGYENVISNLDKAMASPFLTGKVKDFRMDVDFFLNPNRYVDILEGKYDDRNKAEVKAEEEIWQ